MTQLQVMKLSIQHLFFQNELQTTTKFDNIFFENKTELQNKLNHFMFNKKYYEHYGVPRKLIILMHSASECGKTSTIKSITQYTNRHLFSINFLCINTKNGFKNIFIENYAKYKNLSIERKNIIYVFEDIDVSLKCINNDSSDNDNDNENGNNNSENNQNNYIKNNININNVNDENYIKSMSTNKIATDIIMEKTILAPNSLPIINIHPGRSDDINGFDNNFEQKQEFETNKLNKNTMLNVLDGITEFNDVIIMITTNHIEKLDKAFTRAGRMDLKLEFKKHHVKL